MPWAESYSAWGLTWSRLGQEKMVGSPDVQHVERGKAISIEEKLYILACFVPSNMEVGGPIKLSFNTWQIP